MMEETSATGKSSGFGLSNYVDIVTGQKSSNVVPVTLLETSKERGIAQGGATVALGAATGATTAANNPGQHFFATTTPQQQLQTAAAHQAAAQQQQQGQQANSYIPYQQMYTLQQQNLQPLGDNMINVTNGQQMMAQQAMLQQGIAMQQMMPSQMMMAAPGMGYIQMAPSQFGQIGMSHLGPVLIQPFPVQAARAASAPAKPVGRNTQSRGNFGNAASAILCDQSGSNAGKVKKKKPSPSARRRSRLRLIAFLEAKRKKAEEEGIEPTPEERLELETLKMSEGLLNREEPELGNSVETPSSLCQSESSSSNKLLTVAEAVEPTALDETAPKETGETSPPKSCDPETTMPGASKAEPELLKTEA
ncbi:Oidioi.mRNA.OKI2018_I69.XSR.g16533.t1.cds [Oikopleura dioica]|uniref:Oidioi.mRNA.OKI2018_I69.XSR.g16533.t1.cds n=1 Tax=Oikopleura dioica TaxID=34765 RepID=A0ABN7SMR9_OIKDI|nr:Oidioi.mRNA.OKI2018_I69.XSR.g16533.t1.cds [Oikopleura dioica]